MQYESCEKTFTGILIYAWLTMHFFSNIDGFGLVESAATLMPKSFDATLLGKRN